MNIDICAHTHTHLSNTHPPAAIPPHTKNMLIRSHTKLQALASLAESAKLSRACIQQYKIMFSEFSGLHLTQETSIAYDQTVKPTNGCSIQELASDCSHQDFIKKAFVEVSFSSM